MLRRWIIRVLQRRSSSPDVTADSRGHHPAAVLSRPDGFEPVRLPLAGVMHKNNYRHVQRLALSEQVRLRREPANEYDTNAIAAETHAGHRLGYLARSAARLLAPYMDAGNDPLPGAVTELTTDISAGVVGAAVSFHLPKQLASDIIAEGQRWEFACDVGPNGITYLFLNCDEAELNRVNEALRASGLQWIRSGLSYRAAPDGRQYRWYVRLEGGPSEDALRQVLHTTLGTVRYHSDATQTLNEYIALFDGENVALRAENTELRNRILELQGTVRSLSRPRRDSRKDELSAAIRILLPDVRLLRDSLDVIVQEVESCEPILQELQRLSRAPGDVRGERVEAAPRWKERHFRTGQRDDGRLYYTQRDGTWMALVSFKNSQARDVEYLARH